MRFKNGILILLLLLCCPAAAVAEIIELNSAENRIIEAGYLKGEPGKPAILILHGFLQTREFPTVDRLATALNESGYTVLTPSLSLGINRRKKSLACEAIHTHNTEVNTAELELWANWLIEKSGPEIILIGHSAGNQTLLDYMQKTGAAHIASAVFISMSYFGEGPAANETPEHAEKAKAALAKGFDPLDTYAMSFCKQYPTTASNFLSYFDWNRDKIAAIAKRFSDKVNIIIGTGDKRIDQNWRKQLTDNKIRVTAIEGANHFFDQAHEFDLIDAIEAILD